MHFMFLSCKKATELIEKELFSSLTMREKIQLMMHKSMCEACTRYGKQSKELDRYIRFNIEKFAPSKNASSTKVTDKYKKKVIDAID